MCSTVVLPAPFGPSTPVMPAPSEQETSFTATTLPYQRDACLSSTRADPGPEGGAKEVVEGAVAVMPTASDSAAPVPRRPRRSPRSSHTGTTAAAGPAA